MLPDELVGKIEMSFAGSGAGEDSENDSQGELPAGRIRKLFQAFSK
jgi:hypothetical protein